MSEKTNRPELTAALVALLGLKGQFQTEVGAILVPGIQLLDIQNSPYLRYAVPVGGRHSGGPVAARFQHVLAKPGAKVALQITRAIIKCGAVSEVRLRILSAANIASMDSPGTEDAFVAMAGMVMPERRSSRTQNPDRTIATLGEQIGIVTCDVANVDKLVEFPDPGVILFGSDEGGVPALAAICNTANTFMAVTYFGREWPLPS